MTRGLEFLRFSAFCFGGAVLLGLFGAVGGWNLPPAGVSIISFLVGGAAAYSVRQWVKP